VTVRYLLRMDTLLLSKHEAARLLGLSIRSLEQLISRKEIPTRRIGRRVLITRSAVESFAQACSSDNHEPNEVSV
jgi:excisionase family DNA binding protein